MMDGLIIINKYIGIEKAQTKMSARFHRGNAPDKGEQKIGGNKVSAAVSSNTRTVMTKVIF